MFEPTPKQTLILWDVLARGGSAAQAEMPFKVEPKDREALVRAGVVTVKKVGRSLWLTVEERGWSWANDHLDAPLTSLPKISTSEAKVASRKRKPSPAKGTQVTLQLWLQRLKTFLRSENRALSDLFYAAKPIKIDSTEISFAKLRERIRAFVFQIAGNPQRNGVPLSVLRRELSDIDRATLDGTLRRMHSEDGTTLMSLDNPREIEAEGDAPLNLKGQMVHTLWITR